jgi:dUTP pyrophosphatase
MLPDRVIFEQHGFASLTVPSRASHGAAGYDLHASLFTVTTGGEQIGREIKGHNEWNKPVNFTAKQDALGGKFHYTLFPRFRTLIPCGFKTSLPPDVHAEIRPRSGQPWKCGVTVLNAPGSIDSDYRGEWMVMLINHSEVPYEIYDGDRIAQAVFVRHQVYPWQEGSVNETVRGNGGFGSTGK